jgi:type VI secretion system secreted protein VgrG
MMSSNLLAGMGFVALLYGASPALAAVAPTLGAAKTFAVLGASTVTNTGSGVLTGDLGVSPGLAITGFPPGTVTGTTHAGDAVALQAQSDVTTAYNALAGQACNTVLTGQDLGGMTLMPGVYCFSSSAQLTGTLTLNAQGSASAVFVFQIGSTLTTASNSVVQVINTGGGSDCNVFWQVGSSATLGTSTTLAGSILALTSITLTTGANVSGQALARTGAVTLDTNAVSVCTALCPLITVNPATLPTGVPPNVPYNVTISATGGTAPYTFAVPPSSLPPGLTLTSSGSSSALLSGTPTTTGTSIFTIIATDANGCTGFRAYTITINPCPPLTILPATLPNAGVGSLYSQTIVGSGGTAPYTFIMFSSTLPAGLTLTSAGVLAGTPTTTGTTTFTIRGTDANGCFAELSYTILVNLLPCPPITVSPATLPSPALGIPYSQTISASGGTGSYIYTVTAGSLPPGLGLSPLTSTPTVVLSGTPTTSGNFSFTITATDGNGCVGVLGYTVTIAVASTGIPTLSGWGLMTLMVLIGVASIYRLRRI